MPIAVCGTCGHELRRKWLIEQVQASEACHDLRAQIAGSANRLEAILTSVGTPPAAAEELTTLRQLVEQLHAAELERARLGERRAAKLERQEARRRKPAT